MKLRTTVGNLTESFALASPTLDTKGSASNLYLNANDKLGFLYLYSTNLISETATKLKAEIETSGEVLINPKRLVDGLTGLSKDIAVTLSLTASGNSLRVQAGNVKFSLAANTSVRELGDRMKSIPSKAEPVSVIPVTELTEFTKRTVFCIPDDQTGQRANLAALKLATKDDYEEAFATDGSIAVHVKSAKKQGKGVGLGSGLLIPSQALGPLGSLSSKKRGETVSLILTENKNKVFFKFADGTHFGALTMATNYPNLESVINHQHTYHFDIPKEPLKQCLARASFFVNSSKNKNVVELEFGQEALIVKANGDDSLSDTLPITYKGKKPETPFKVGLNIKHLFNIASSSNSENLTLGFTKEDSPISVIDHEGEDDDRIYIQYVVMCVRLPKT